VLGALADGLMAATARLGTITASCDTDPRAVIFCFIAAALLIVIGLLIAIDYRDVGTRWADSVAESRGWPEPTYGPSNKTTGIIMMLFGLVLLGFAFYGLANLGWSLHCAPGTASS
jgi:hypothetical protein